MNEGAKAANEHNRARAEQTDRDQMIHKLDRMIRLLEQIEQNTRQTVSVPTLQVIPATCTCGQGLTSPCPVHPLNPPYKITCGSSL